MALIYVDSFDTYQTTDILKRWSSLTGTPEIEAGGRTSNRMTFLAQEGVNLGVPSQTTYLVGCAFKVNTLPDTTGTVMVFFGSTSQSECGLCLTSSGALAVFRVANTGSAGEGLGFGSVKLDDTDGGIISANVWYYLEVKMTLSNTAGAWEVKVNGVPVLVETGSSGYDNVVSEAAIKKIGVGQAVGGSAGLYTYIDDLYICDTSGSVNNDFLGDVTVEAIFPQTDAVAAGTHEDFTCSTGADQGAMVDESATDFPDEDTTYIYSSTVGHQSTFNYPNITPAAATICGVQVNICAKKSTTGTRTYKSLAKLSAGAATEGATAYAPSDTSYAYGCDVWEAKPGGGVWTVSDVNGAEFGVTVEA